MSSKQEFANKIKGSISVGECVIAPFGDSSDVLVLDRDWYYEAMRCNPDIEDFDEYEDAEGYCSEACFLDMSYKSLSEEEKKLFDAFEDVMRSGMTLAECSRTEIVWKSMYDFEWDLKRFLEAK